MHVSDLCLCNNCVFCNCLVAGRVCTFSVSYRRDLVVKSVDNYTTVLGTGLTFGICALLALLPSNVPVLVPTLVDAEDKYTLDPLYSFLI